MAPTYISQADAARQLSITRQGVSYLIRQGLLRTTTIAGRAVLTELEVMQYAKTRRAPGWLGYHANRVKSLKKKNNTKE